jgi:phage gp36-like protein
MSTLPPPDSYGVANECDLATVDYFIEIFGFNEALELSRLEDPTSNTINYERIQVALNDAAALINNYISTSPPQGKILIAGSYRRTQAILARWYLDTLRPRQQVIDAAESALKQLDLWSAKASPSSGFKWQEAYRYWSGACSMVMSSYQRDRAFTHSSLSRWEGRWGTNNRYSPFVRKGAIVRDVPIAREKSGSLEQPTFIGDSTLEVNQLFDALETTRNLESFPETQNLVNAEDNDVAVGNEDEGFDSYGGLQASDDTF